jgi:hypothetical protein
VSNATHRRTKRARFAPIAIGTGALAAVLLSVTMSGSLAGFTAQITNSTNNVSTGVLTMKETGGAATCNSTDTAGATNGVNTNSFTCATINKYGGGTLIPGTTAASSSSQVVSITNTGNVTANTFTLQPGACTQAISVSTLPSGNASDLCSKLFLTITDSSVTGGTTTVTTPLASTALSALSATTPIALPVAAAGNVQTFTFTISFPSTGASTDNSYQNLKASQALVWTYNS